MIRKKNVKTTQGFFLLEVVIAILLVTGTALIIARYQHTIQVLEMQTKQHLQAVSLAIYMSETDTLPDNRGTNNFVYSIKKKEAPVFIAELPLDEPYMVRTITVKWTDYTQQTRTITVKTGAYPKNRELLHES